MSYLPHAIAMIQRETGALAALDPGPAKRAELAAAIASSHQLAALLTSFLHQLRTQIVEFTTFAQVQAQSSALRAQIDAHFRQAGLTRCAS